MSFQTLKVEELQQGTIIKVTLWREKALNAMNPKFFEELATVFRQINKSQNVRAVILDADGKVFTAGLDLKEAASILAFDSEQDTARVAIKLYAKIRELQQSFVDVFECKVPVITGVHSMCIGGGIDLVSMADIRYCTQDAQFTIKEIDIGMCADLGTMQMFPKHVGNQSTFKELAYTGRIMKAEEALQIGFVSRILEDKQKLKVALLETAQLIASKSPVGIHTIKQTLRKAESKEFYENLESLARTNSGMLQTKDMQEAITAFLMKKKPSFPKL